MSFMNGNGDLIHSYNPTYLSNYQTEHRLQENQELIGVYGIYGKNKFYDFLSFGFLVKEKIIE